MTRTDNASADASWLRRLLRLIFRITTVLLIFAAGLAVAAWAKSRTPLEPFELPADLMTPVATTLPSATRYHFPGARWIAADPAALGWSVEGLAAVHDFARGLDTSALMIVHRGHLIAAWGDVDVRENSQSLRKALLSSLYGDLVTSGRLDLDASLADLGIDDTPPLRAEERQATVRQLLLSRSGIYRPSIYEAGSWKRRKPAPGSHPPGTHWFYNNWDFNALGTIYARVADEPLERAFADHIAGPIGMEDYRPQDVVYVDRDDLPEHMMGNDSDHPAYVFMISARDLARFGLLYLAGGHWQERQVLPPGWVEESTFEAALPTSLPGWSMGFMWWIHQPTPDALPRLVTRGGRGHRLSIVPERDLVVVHRIPDGGVSLGAQLFRRFVWHGEVSDEAHDELMRRILAAHPDGPG